MPYTPQQEFQFKREFAARRRRQILITGLFVLPVVMVALFRLHHPGTVDATSGPGRMWAAAFIATLVVGIGASFLNWRCPACGSGLSRTLNQRFCSKCGVALQ